MKNDAGFNELFQKAREAGLAAGSGHKPVPMVVGKAKDLLSNEIDYNKRTYFVPQGVCGFAWVSVRPGTSSFARWLVKNKLGRKAYEGGIQVWVSEFGQSMEKKEAFASAFAKVLQDAGINAYAGSRMD